MIHRARDFHYNADVTEQQYKDLAIFIPLCQCMMQQIPKERPTASEALAKFEELVMTMDSKFLRSTIRCADGVMVSTWERRDVRSLIFVLAFSTAILFVSFILVHIFNSGG